MLPASPLADSAYSAAKSPLDLRALRATAGDRMRMLREIVVRSLLTYAVMICYALGLVPLVVPLFANLVLYFKVYGAVHDLGHGWTAKRAGIPARFVPISNPIWGGVAIFRLTHEGHHHYLGTTRDPWLPYYAGHPLRALLYSFIEPERNLLCYLKLRGFNRELWLNIAYHLACFCGSTVLFHRAYVAHVLIQRATHALAIFAFNFYTHRANFSPNAPIGTWNRQGDLRRWLPLMRLIWGEELVRGLTLHKRHHIIGQAHVIANKYHLLSDSGPFTRCIEQWPIASVQQVAGDSGASDQQARHQK